MKRLELCLSTDDNYAKYAAVVIYSALKNKKNDEDIIFHILYSNLSTTNIEKLKSMGNIIFHKLDNSLFEPYFYNGVCTNVTIPTLYRLKLPSLLPDVKRVLYLDCDIIVLSSLSSIYFCELSANQYAACVPDLAQDAHMLRMNLENSCSNFYFNAGVCLLDLEKMRENNVENKMFDYLRNNWEKLSYSDQDVMNAVLLGHVKKMGREFNFITPNFYFKNNSNPAIVHFAGTKPWKIGFYNNYREMFWKYYMSTPFSSDLKQILIKNITFFMHCRFCQFLWFFKMYPIFFLKDDRKKNFMRIVKSMEFNY